MRALPRHARSDESGAALILALFFTALLAVIVVEYCYEMRIEASLVGNQVEQMGAQLGAESGIAVGMSLLQSDLDNTDGTGGGAFDALTDTWAQGLPFQELGNASVRCEVSDEYAKINLNALVAGAEGETNPALEHTLRILFTQRGAEIDPTDAIIDWLDSDDEQRGEGAETDYYSALDGGYGCKNGHMDSVEELLLIKGMTPIIFFGDPEKEQQPLTELLTVYGDLDGKVNANTAPREVLEAIAEGVGRPGLADIIIQDREQQPFESVDDLTSRGILESSQQQTGQNGQNGQASQEGAALFGVASRVFRIDGDGMVNKSQVRITAYILRDPEAAPNAFRVLDWRILK